MDHTEVWTTRGAMVFGLVLMAVGAACRVRQRAHTPLGCGTAPAPRSLQWHPSVAAALGALRNPLVVEVPSDARAIEVDGDGLPDAMFWVTGSACAPGCVVVRHSPSGWSAEALSGGVRGDEARSAVCRGPIDAAGRAVVSASVQGCRDVPGHPGVSVCARKTVIWAALPGQPFRAVYFGPAAQGEVGDIGALRDGSVMLIARDGLPEGVEAPQHAVLTWNADHTALQQASCWQRLEPERAPAAVSGCTLVAREPFELWAYDSANAPEMLYNVEHRLEVIAPARPRRGASRMFCTRVTAPLVSPAYGHVYLRPDQLSGCPVFPP